MITRPHAALTLAFVAPCLVSASDLGESRGVELAQLTVRERVVIRIPRMDSRAFASRPLLRAPVVWSEKKAAKCVPSAKIVGASMAGGDVDLLTGDGRRLRAKLDENCPALDFYTGFYLRPAPDGMICARRDTLRSRSGARCEIARFKTLVAQR